MFNVHMCSNCVCIDYVCSRMINDTNLDRMNMGGGEQFVKERY